MGALVGGAQPGGPLYGVRTMLLGEPPSVHDDRIVLTAKTEFEHVQQMIAQGQWDQAQERLTALGDTVQTVNDTQRKQDLIDQWNRLNVQVQNRDPSAVPPPSSAPTTELPAVSTPPTSLMLSVPSPEATPAPPTRHHHRPGLGDDGRIRTVVVGARTATVDTDRYVGGAIRNCAEHHNRAGTVINRG
ncbi:Anti-sigma-D factor RsdA [Mycobacterium talmoniae]|uniref:Anti-sigma-D factor RsdA n=1 Tax=Mycobacterium talmoniae TaxID=1858794 RepID=A0A2S8BGK0_9MYCO|nr:Anti-sigma-D factor RsdA [Mycobacterium talmoniae]